ncbi:response regulator [Rhizobium sp. 16-488-2a]|nr:MULTISPECIES: response regulator [unclassified Rhizobium]MBO9122515.1 response regulator [Rhizobium sp. 16-488-2b]MBO9173046.1 response regulator [Rhizobium sp. 16-488-2a]
MFVGLKQSQSSLTETRRLVHSNPVAVLVVDDEALIRFAIVDELADQGFDVHEAANADEAIALVEKYPEIRLIFTDIDMPGSMDGLKLAAFVRDRWPPIKIIVTSGRVKPSADMMPEGVPFLPKPYEFPHVIAAINKLLTA